MTSAQGGMLPATSAGILDGVKVLDLTRIIAGPWCMQQLAEMGATVYKIERPGVGDDMCHFKPTLSRPDGSPAMDSTSHLGLNRSKHSITVDIGQAAG